MCLKSRSRRHGVVMHSIWIISPIISYFVNSQTNETLAQRYQRFRSRQLKSILPQLPLQFDVLGSIFQTAYYFVDLQIGAPKSQSLSVIVDTGSSTQGIPCHDCEACGQEHWEKPYDRNISNFNQRMPCGECQTCRLNTANDSLKALADPLANATGPEFSKNAAKLLLFNAELMQCLYHVTVLL